QDKSQDEYFIEGKNKTHLKDAYMSSKGFPAIAISLPIKNRSGEIIGVIMNRYKLDELNKILADRVGMGETGESYLVNANSYMITESRLANKGFLTQKVDTDPVRLFHDKKKIMSGVYRDYRNQLVLGASNGDNLDNEFNKSWIILSEIDSAEAFSPAAKLFNIMILSILIVGALVIIIALIVSQNMTKPIINLANVTSKVAGGDLTVDVIIEGNDEIGLLAQSFKNMVKNLKDVLAKLRDATNQMTSSGNEILSASQEQAAGAREQSSAVAETTSAAKELSATSEQVGESIRRVSQAATNALVGLVKIKEAIGKTSTMITLLGEKSQQIGKITDLIDDVADQTNLLAVNASIEAARAGEQGRGFTVVADEIRKLADSSAKSTKDITALIELIQHEMTNSIMSMETSVSSIDDASRLAQQTTEISKEITMNVTQQISGSKQIADAMVNIDETMKQIAAGAQQSQAAVKQLTELSKDLQSIVSKFKIS
ncbi:MAG: methyl-accepting chemotaxis protein, partial [Candidatus Omnitrophica bacterium]|nr:methyl-accepting chemotaxis protein [Candidatus Omnitrophota bacterium]